MRALVSRAGSLKLLAGSFLLLATAIALGRWPVIAPTSVPVAGVMPDHQAQVQMSEVYGKLPLSFEPNQGQTDAQVRFLSRGLATRCF